MSLFTELKRRNVFRVAAGYAVFSWLLLQVGDVMFETLELPAVWGKGLLAILALGLAPALIFSWVYELTPEGLRKESEIEAGESGTTHTARKLDLVVIILLVLAIGLFAWERQSEGPSVAADNRGTVAETERVTIAVLPFVNLSNDPEQAFFSDGITEEILNILVRERALKVVSRTSAFSIKGQSLDIPTIARRLGAAYVIEGSVRRADNTLRITAQLIEAASDTHLWSDTFDRPYADVFAVQEEIAGAISSALRDSLGLGSSANTASAFSRMDNLVAYEDFLRARAQLRAREISAALVLFERVLAQEPDFGPAWSLYSICLSYLPLFEPDSELVIAGTHRYMARRAARRAMALAPDDSNAHYAQGAYARIDNDPLAELQHYADALAIDPENPLALEDMVETMIGSLLFEQARPFAQRLRAADPLWWVGKYINNRWLGSIKGLESSLPMLESLAGAQGSFSVVHNDLIQDLLRLGHWEQAIAAQATARQILKNGFPVDSAIAWDLPAIRQWAGNPNRGPLLESALTDAQGQMSIALVNSPIFLFSPDRDEIFALAEDLDLYGIRDFLRSLSIEPELNALWSDPRARDLILKLERRQDYSLPAVWHARGWPRFCRPLGDDDFECGVFE